MKLRADYHSVLSLLSFFCYLDLKIHVIVSPVVLYGCDMSHLLRKEHRSTVSKNSVLRRTF